MVIFQIGSFGCKKYPEMLPGETVLLRQGKYIMDLGNGVIFMDDPFENIRFDLFAVSTKALLNLHVDLKRDSLIPLTLDRRGNFNRTDVFRGSVNIRDFFSLDCERGCSLWD